MRLSTWSLLASLLLVCATAASAQTDSTDRPSPPNPSQELAPTDATDGSTSAGPSSMGYPVWQVPPGGYGAYGDMGGYGGWNGPPCYGQGDGCGDHGCCCNSCCKPTLRYRLKALRAKLCASLSRCRKCPSSCCAENTSCCHGSDTPDFHGDVPVNVQDQEVLPATPQSDLLPVPPPEPNGYDNSSDNQQTSGAATVARRQSHKPRMKSVKSRKPRRS